MHNAPDQYSTPPRYGRPQQSSLALLPSPRRPVKFTYDNSPTSNNNNSTTTSNNFSTNYTSSASSFNPALPSPISNPPSSLPPRYSTIIDHNVPPSYSSLPSSMTNNASPVSTPGSRVSSRSPSPNSRLPTNPSFNLRQLHDRSTPPQPSFATVPQQPNFTSARPPSLTNLTGSGRDPLSSLKKSDSFRRKGSAARRLESLGVDVTRMKLSDQDEDDNRDINRDSNRGSYQDRNQHEMKRSNSRRSVLTSSNISSNNSSPYSSSHNGGSSSRNFRGLVGLANLGNTCFMNSCLQCVLATQDMCEYFGSGAYAQHLCSQSRLKGKLATAFGELVSAVKNGRDHSVERPSDLKRLVSVLAPQFAGYGQHDSQEFLRFLLAGLHDDVNRIVTKPAYEEIKDGDEDSDDIKSDRWWQNYTARNVSVPSAVFCGQLCSTIRCQTCSHVSKAFDPFWDLSLPIPKATAAPSAGYGARRSSYSAATSSICNLFDCFRLFVEEELLTGMDQYYCSKCKTHRDCTKSLAIFRFPKVLVIHLKRFSFGQYSRSKLSADVRFPHDLDLTRYQPAVMGSKNDLHYKLFAVSNHMGGTGGGHYTAHCNVSPDMNENSWYTFNDSSVSHVRADSIGGSSAYVLFYRRV